MESVHKIMNTTQCFENKISTRNPCDFFLSHHREHIHSNSYYSQTATNKHNVPLADNLYKSEPCLYQSDWLPETRPEMVLNQNFWFNQIKTVNGISRRLTIHWTDEKKPSEICCYQNNLSDILTGKTNIFFQSGGSL